MLGFISISNYSRKIRNKVFAPNLDYKYSIIELQLKIEKIGSQLIIRALRPFYYRPGRDAGATVSTALRFEYRRYTNNCQGQFVSACAPIVFLNKVNESVSTEVL